MSQSSPQYRIKVEGLPATCDGVDDGMTYGVGHIVESPMAAPLKLAANARVLVPVIVTGADMQLVNASRCIAVPEELPMERVLLVPRLALALYAWEMAALELGEYAVVTTGSADTGLYGLVATWRSGRAPICLDLRNGSVPQEIERIIEGSDDPQAAIDALGALLREAPGAAAIVLGQSATAVDIIMEAMPNWGRILFGMRAMEPAAIDFYNHVHRKGARVLGITATPMFVFDHSMRPQMDIQVQRAIRILEHPQLAERCMRQVA